MCISDATEKYEVEAQPAMEASVRHVVKLTRTCRRSQLDISSNFLFDASDQTWNYRSGSREFSK